MSAKTVINHFDPMIHTEKALTKCEKGKPALNNF